MILYSICAIIVIIDAILSIFLFFKILGMCNDVRQIKVHFCGHDVASQTTNLKARVLAGDASTAIDVKKQFVTELNAIAKKAQGMTDEDYERIYGTTTTADINMVINKYQKLYTEIGIKFPTELARVKTIEDLWEVIN